MEFGVHLPLLAWDEEPFDPASLTEYARTADRLGFSAVSVNDHLQHRRPWLDGLTALASVVGASGDMTLATTIALAVVRTPVPLAKALAAIDLLSGGRLVVGLGPGSYKPDYEAAGVPWEERWPRFDEAIRALRALWRPDGDPFDGEFYSTRGVRLEPGPAQDGGPPIWIGSWGSDTGLRRVARLGDGWLASGYNTTPELFKKGTARLRELLPAHGEGSGHLRERARDDDDPHRRRSGEGPSRAGGVGGTTALGRTPDELGDRLLVASAEECAERLSRYAAAGVQRVFLWPVGPPIRQLELFRDRVAPLIG